MQDLTLYYMPTCPYCGKVLRYLQGEGIKVAQKNISESPAIRQELITIGGKGQVPCLVIDGLPMYESDDIINWFKSEYKK